MSLVTRINRARLRFDNTRRVKRALPPYVIVTLSGEITELPHPMPQIPFGKLVARVVPLPSGPQSAHWFRNLLERLSGDARVEGIVLKIACEANAAVYQSLREAIFKFRAAGKRVVAYAESFGPFQYYLACACDQIVMPPPAEFRVVGFSNEYVFFKDALDRVGIGVDVVNVSPFKSAFDQYQRTDFSEQSRAQAEWLLDARYQTLIDGIATGRNMIPEQARARIDSAPHGARDCVGLGLIDAALYEDEIEHWLKPASATPPAPDPVSPVVALATRLAPALAKRMGDAQKAEKATSRVWCTLSDAEKTLKRVERNWFEKQIGIVGIEGLIISGTSRRSPLPIPLFGGSAVAGSESVAQALRNAERDDTIAGVVIFIDSQGGDALASDLMAREIKRLMRKKPVVAYMSGVAASGGYYVAAPVQHIVARPLTITGSIGVITAKPHTAGLYDRLSLHRTALTRGANAQIFSDMQPLDERARNALAQSIGRIYGDFKDIVAAGRHKPNDDALEALCGGRVWTGAQALDHGLVDQLGSFGDAVEKVTALAKLAPGGKRVGWRWITPPRTSLLPPAFAAQSPVAWLEHLEWLRRFLANASALALGPWGSDLTR